jgi:hypothetical protein
MTMNPADDGFEAQEIALRPTDDITILNMRAPIRTLDEDSTLARLVASMMAARMGVIRQLRRNVTLIQSLWRQRLAHKEFRLRIAKRRQQRAEIKQEVRRVQETVRRELERQKQEMLQRFSKIKGMPDATLMAQKIWRGIKQRRIPLPTLCEICAHTVLASVPPPCINSLFKWNDRFQLHQITTPNGDVLREKHCKHDYCVGCVRNYLVSGAFLFLR